MKGDATALEENLQGGVSETNIDLFMHQLIRNTVVMMIYLDMIIDVDPGGFPFGVKIRMSGKGLESGFFKRFEQALTTTGKLFKCMIVESFQLPGHGFVQLGQTKELPIP